MFIQSICPFKIGLFVLFVIEFYEFLIYLDINPLPDMWFVNIFSHPVGCFFITFFKKICFIYVFLAALGLRCCMGFSLVGPTGAALQLWWHLLLWSMGFRACGLRWLQLPCSKTRVQEWWCTGLAASQHWGIFPEQRLNPCFLN